MILFPRFFTTFKCTNHLYCITGSSSSNHVNNVRPYMKTGLRNRLLQVSLFCLSPPQRPLCVVGGLGEKEKESALGTIGRGKREEKLPPFPSSHRSPRAFYFLIIAIFIGMPCAGLCGGESCFAINLVRVREPGFHVPNSACAFSLPKFCIYNHCFQYLLGRM